MSDFDSLIRRAQRKSLFAASDTIQEVRFGRQELQKILPHRKNFLLLDEVDAVDLHTGLLRARRHISPEDPIFDCQLSDHLVFPGVLLVDTIRQAGACMVFFHQRKAAEIPEDTKHLAVRHLKIHRAVFVAEVRPDDSITVVSQLLEDNGLTATVMGQVLKGPQICAASISEMYLVDNAP